MIKKGIYYVLPAPFEQRGFAGLGQIRHSETAEVHMMYFCKFRYSEIPEVHYETTEDTNKMNAQERLKRKRRRQLQRALRFWAPIGIVALLILGLTAGGVVLSISQTKQTGPAQESKGSGQANDNKQDSKENESQQAAESEEAESGGSDAQETETAPASEDDKFEELLAQIRAGQAADYSYLTPANSSFASVKSSLLAIDESQLAAESRDLYDILKDKIEIEEAGTSLSAPADGQTIYGSEGGTAYYEWLLKKLTGVDDDAQTIHDRLANELNAMYGLIHPMLDADPMLAQNAESAKKTGADDAYKYSTVTAGSDDLKLVLACDGLANGWGEFGLIRAYLLDTSLDENVRNYLVDSVRMTYAMYGLLDYYINHEGWTQDQVAELCSSYFGSGQESLAATIYQSSQNEPGRYAAAAISYLELTEIESTLAQQNQDSYTEQVLFDFLFGRGPATFRVYRSWLAQ